MSHEHYSRVWASIWLEPWTDDMRLLALYLLTGPHRRSEGLYRLPPAYAAADLRWAAKRLRAAWDALIEDGFIEHDPDTDTVLIVNTLKRHGFNGKQEAGIVKAVAELPPSPLLERFVSLCETHNPSLAKALRKALPKA